jgi:TRAP-type C4-dicarboxylate transport system substrate-binding protein
MKCKGLKALVSALVLISATAGTGQAQTQVKFAWNLAMGSYTDNATKKMAACIQDALGSKFKMATYPAGQLYNGPQIMDAVRKGALEFGELPLGVIGRLDPIVGVVYLPFVVDNQEQMFKALHGELGATLQRVANKVGIHILGYTPGSGGTYGNNIRPLRTPANFNGLSIRVPSAPSAKTVLALGGTPTTLAPSEVYLALQRGTVNGANQPFAAFTDRNLYEVVKYITLSDITLDPDVEIVNAAFWNALPDKTRKEIEACKVASEKWARAEEQRRRVLYIEGLRKRGVEVITLTPAERKQWVDATRPVVEKFIADHGEAGRKMINYLNSLK